MLLVVGLFYFGLTAIAKEARPALKQFSNLKLAVFIIGALVFIVTFIVVLKRIKNNYYVVTEKYNERSQLAYQELIGYVKNKELTIKTPFFNIIKQHGSDKYINVYVGI